MGGFGQGVAGGMGMGGGGQQQQSSGALSPEIFKLLLDMGQQSLNKGLTDTPMVGSAASSPAMSDLQRRFVFMQQLASM